jgi:N,N'-diacetyllegionaminate synthase
VSAEGGTLIIAEAGVNHNGDERLALRLIDAAADAGADMIKFQTFSTDALACFSAKKAAYQHLNSPGAGETLQAMLRRLELKPEWYRALLTRCREKGIGFLSTPFDIPSIGLLVRLGLKLLKIPSGDITNLPYLRVLGSVKCKLILVDPEK